MECRPQWVEWFYFMWEDGPLAPTEADALPINGLSLNTLSGDAPRVVRTTNVNAICLYA